MQIVEWVIAALAVLSILFFLIYAIGIFRAPTGQRPATPTYSRFGERLPAAPNPGFQEESEEHEHP